MRSGSRRCGLILLAGVAIATPALNPPYLTGGV
ncbi:TPA: conjugal transfer protein, partial [Streptococcus pyogenes]